LAPVENFISLGDWKNLGTDAAGIEVATYNLNGETLALVVQHVDGQNRCVGKDHSPT
jgi:hypothetical protein